MAIAPNDTALQHRPRPLTLFLEMLRSETAAEPGRTARALAGLRAYQEAERPDPTGPMPAIAEIHGAALRDYGGNGRPVLFVPSLINPPSVLDIGPDRSLLRWLAAQGHHVLLLDWGIQVPERRHLSLGAHVEEILLPLLAALGAPAVLAGYCLGGTMAVAAAALEPPPALVTIAAPWRFAGFSPSARAMLANLWQGAKPFVETHGLLPMEVLQTSFWSLDPARTIGKFEAFADFEPGGDKARSFVALEDWANDGPPLPAAAAREMFEDLFAADLPGEGGWQVGGKAVNPAAVPCPQLHVVSEVDHIVPAATAIRSGEHLELSLGHVGMIVGSRGRDALWRPLSDWLFRTAAN